MTQTKLTKTQKVTTKKSTTTRQSTKTDSLKKRKTSTKATVNKSATRKKTTRTTKKKVFIEIPEDKFFILINGEKLTHYVDLAHKLEDLEQHIIHHHVTPFRHDFANWIKDVFEEEDLAEKVAKLNEPEKIRTVIYKHIIKKHLK